jgi:hypothetical protein
MLIISNLSSKIKYLIIKYLFYFIFFLFINLEVTLNFNILEILPSYENFIQFCQFQKFGQISLNFVSFGIILPEILALAFSIL